MKIHLGFEDISTVENSVITIGTYDGVHTGHKKVLCRLVALAKQQGLASVIITFSPHPRIVLGGHSSDIKLLDTEKEKYKEFEKLGIDHVVVIPFTKEFSKLSYKTFVEDYLIKKLKIRVFVFGKDHQFGHKRQGNISSLNELAVKHKFTVEYVNTFEDRGVDVSSTKIREALKRGDIDSANRMLGRQFKISARVTDGYKVGSQLGFPTANLQITDTHKIRPAQGVYAVEVAYKGHLYKGMLNIGSNPTVKSDNNISVEVHILNFDKSIYQETLEVFFIKRIREEIKFENIQALKNQLENDKKIVEALLSEQ